MSKKQGNIEIFHENGYRDTPEQLLKMRAHPNVIRQLERPAFKVIIEACGIS
jgi:hypothetical protein